MRGMMALDMGCDRKRNISDDSKVLGLRSQQDKVALADVAKMGGAGWSNSGGGEGWRQRDRAVLGLRCQKMIHELIYRTNIKP